MWLPIIILLVIFALFGLLAGIIGIIVEGKMLKQLQLNFLSAGIMLMQGSEKIQVILNIRLHGCFLILFYWFVHFS
ncbi:MAG: hypothetical protein MZV64_28695 [Ignavibacteriales bacterium]|nr:hypothetical protein [Ignavibacteriales bacterium]